MYCTHCGKLVSDQSKFCTNCGHRLNTKPYQGPLPQQPHIPDIYYGPLPRSQQISAWKLIITACLLLGTVFYAIYYFAELLPGMFRSMRYMPFYCICGLISGLGFVVAMCLASVHLFSRDPRHTPLRMAAAIFVGAGALQSFSYLYLIAEGLQLKTPVMLILTQLCILAGGIMMLMNLTGSLMTNLPTVLANAGICLMMLIGVCVTSGNTALSVLGGFGYILVYAALAMLFVNREEPSLIPGRRADGIR